MTGLISPTATLDAATRALSEAYCPRCNRKLGRGRYEAMIGTVEIDTIEDGRRVTETKAIRAFFHAACSLKAKGREACRGR